jgi:adenylylsulfate kinase-like enzyme
MAKKGLIKQGVLVWITGLPGSGKTTLAQTLYKLIEDKLPSVCIDGDAIRNIMGNDLGYNMKDRLANAYRIARLNKYLVDHNLIVVCSTVSLFKEIHQWNRENIKNLIEVYIDVPMDILIKRDQKKMYTQALKGKKKNVRGFDQSFDIPEKPDLIIKNSGGLDSFLKNIKKIKKLINNKYNIKQ